MSRLTLPTTAQLQSRRTYQIDNFFGVDYSSQKFKVNPIHSINAKNFIRRGNVLQKRYGYKQVLENKKHHFNMVADFIDNKNTKRYVASIGTSLYEITQSPFDLKLIKENCVLDKKINSFPSNNRLYVLGGKKYLLVENNTETNNLEVFEVANSKYAYIPTTTIGITSTDSAIGKRESLDSVNLLTYWRKNSFISGTHYVSADDKTIITDIVQEFLLDTSITYREQKEIEDITIDITFSDTTTEQFEMDRTTSLREFTLKPAFCKGINLKGLDENHTIDEIIKEEKSIDGVYILVHYGVDDFNIIQKDNIKDKTLLVNDTSGGTEVGFKIYGYISLTGSVVLFNDYNNPNFTNNIRITFPHFIEKDYLENNIDKCTFGTIYNANEITSLFVSGNELHPSRDWHSETINASALNEEELKILNTRDLVYFADTSYCDYGEDKNNPILGYDILGTGDLLVLKKYQRYEPTIYFRTGKLEPVYNDYGKQVGDLVGRQLYRSIYSLTTSNIGKSAIGFNVINNFHGDTIFIANDNTIQGLDKETKSYDNQRYANSRSFYLDEYFKNKDLTSAQLFTKEDFLYINVGKELFVYKYGEITSRNYEFYHLEYDLEIDYLFEIENKVYFSDKVGNVYLLEDEQSFVDQKSFELKEGEITTIANSNMAIINEKLLKRLRVGQVIELHNNKPIELIGDNTNDFQINLENKELTLLNIMLKGKLLSYKFIRYLGVDYRITELSDNKFIMQPKSELSEVNANDNNIYGIVDLIDIEKIDVVNSTVYFKDINFGSSIALQGIVYEFQNVSCNYMTAPILFNSAYMRFYKNIYEITITNDTGLPSELSVELIDNENSLLGVDKVNISRGANGLNLGNLSYERYSLTQNKVPIKTKSVRRNILKKEYIVLNFFNDSNTNCVLSRVGFTFSIGGIII